MTQHQQQSTALAVFLGVLGALFVTAIVVWVGVSMATANDEAECAVEQADDTLSGLTVTNC